MIVTKKHLPRRTFLRGMGATLALPMLESNVSKAEFESLWAAGRTRAGG